MFSSDDDCCFLFCFVFFKASGTGSRVERENKRAGTLSKRKDLFQLSRRDPLLHYKVQQRNEWTLNFLPTFMRVEDFVLTSFGCF